MPELPEVDLARRQLERWLKGQRLVEVTAHPGSPLRQTKPRDLARLEGHTLRTVTRRGKHLALQFDRGLGVYLHLGMTGKIVHRRRGAPEPRFSKVCFRLARDEVHFCDSRRFGRCLVSSRPRSCATYPSCAFSVRMPGLALPSAARSSASFCPAAGRREAQGRASRSGLFWPDLGNIHAVEALWRAQLSPFVRTNALTPAQVRQLRKGIHESLAFAMRNLEVDPVDGEVLYVEEGARNPFAVYDREGKPPCRRSDRTPIRRGVQAQRSTFYCPHCQR